MRDIGKNIRYYREKKGYSQEQLAQLRDYLVRLTQKLNERQEGGAA